MRVSAEPRPFEFQKLVQLKIHFDWLWHVMGAIFFNFGLFGLYYTGPWVITFWFSISTVEIFEKMRVSAEPRPFEFQKLVQFKIHFDWLWHVLGAIFFKLCLFGLYYTGAWVITFWFSISTVEIFEKNEVLGSAEALWVPEISSIQDSLWLTLTCYLWPKWYLGWIIAYYSYRSQSPFYAAF